MDWEREIIGADVLKNVFTKNWICVNAREEFTDLATIYKEEQ